jgi:hypothetical protein
MADNNKNWYCAVNGVRQGPFTLDELRALSASGAVGPSDLVWHPAFGAEWREAGLVEDLSGTEAPPPLPPPVEQISGEPLSGITGNRPSCLDAVAQAFERMKALLFRPFDPLRWFSIGFCAWLAFIGTERPPSSRFFLQAGQAPEEALKQSVDSFLDWTRMAWLSLEQLAVIAVVMALGIFFALLLCRLRSRGDFMFLHRWYQPDASVSQCWRASREAGRELFVWRVYFFLIAGLLFALIAVAAYAKVARPYLAAGME